MRKVWLGVWRARSAHTSFVAIFEAATGLSRIANCPPADGLALVHRFLAEAGAEVMAIDCNIGRTAFGRYGKGRHPAGLNLGACFAYACAGQLDAPMLCKGNDFPRTDMDLG